MTFETVQSQIYRFIQSQSYTDFQNRCSDVFLHLWCFNKVFNFQLPFNISYCAFFVLILICYSKPTVQFCTFVIIYVRHQIFFNTQFFSIQYLKQQLYYYFIYFFDQPIHMFNKCIAFKVHELFEIYLRSDFCFNKRGEKCFIKPCSSHLKM